MYDCSYVAMNMDCVLGVIKCLICVCMNSGGSCFSHPSDMSRLSEISSAHPFLPARAVAQAMSSSFEREHVSLRRGGLA